MATTFDSFTARAIETLSKHGADSSRATARAKPAAASAESAGHAQERGQQSPAAAPQKVVSARIKRLMKADY